MEVEILSCLDGAREARGISVIIDVFRASNTILACLGQGAECVIPASSLDDARGLKEKNSSCLLFGERKGLVPDGFDYGNSPDRASGMLLKGKRVIITTSAGTQGILGAVRSDEIIVGSFANACAVVEYINKRSPQRVSLVAIGFESHRACVEDELCAEYIKERLLGKCPDFEGVKKEILRCDGADRLRRLKQDDDLDFCLKLDVFDIVPVFDFESGCLFAR